ncbi:hypothetical protein KQI65_14955 [bacterium]|nr:hypothetical protein [bacterium]
MKEIITVLNAYTRDGLRDGELLAAFLQHAADRGKHAELGDLSFTAKYLTRVQSAIHKQTPQSDLYAKLEEEFSYGVHSFHAKVKEFVADGEEEFRSMVDRHVLAVSQPALRNLMHLAEDFAWMKNWELEMTRDDGDNHRPDGKGNPSEGEETAMGDED